MPPFLSRFLTHHHINLNTHTTMKKLTTLLAAIVFGLGSLAHAAETTSTYPLKTCVVSDEGLEEMGKPYIFTYEGQEVQLCCKDCVKEFHKDPAKYMKKLEAAKAGESTSTKATGDDHSGHSH